MKRSLIAVVLVLAVLLPAASLLAAAFDCGAPCCHRGEAQAKFVPACCEPAMTRDAQPVQAVKSTVTTTAPVAIRVTSTEASIRPQEHFEVSVVAPPPPTRLRLATLSTLLI